MQRSRCREKHVHHTNTGSSRPDRNDPGERQHQIDVHTALAGEQRIFRRATKLHTEEA